jgi:hypothetical protein
MEHVEAMIEVAQRDPSIARVLREICALQGTVRSTALDLVAAHVRTHAAARDLLECVAALRRDEVARRIVDALGPQG